MAWGSGNVGGGGGGNKSTIFVTAPAGTTQVSAAYNRKIKQAKQKDGKWILTGLDYGPGVEWEVTAKRGAERATVKQPMERQEIFYISMDYGVFLYKNGDEYTGRTGGWAANKTTAGSIAKNKTDITMAVSGVNIKDTYAAICTVKKIDFTDAKTLLINPDWLQNHTPLGKYTHVRFGLIDHQPAAHNDMNKFAAAIRDNAASSLDVSEIKGSYHVALFVALNGSVDYNAKIVLKEMVIK